MGRCRCMLKAVRTHMCCIAHDRVRCRSIMAAEIQQQEDTWQQQMRGVCHRVVMVASACQEDKMPYACMDWRAGAACRWSETVTHTSFALRGGSVDCLHHIHALQLYINALQHG